MRYVIKDVLNERYLFGNKTFDPSRELARVFESKEEAQCHIQNWFDNSTNRYVILPK